MPPVLLDIDRLRKRPSPAKLRYDLIAKLFGELSTIGALPDAKPVLAAASRFTTEQRTEWQRAIAEELLLRHACGLPVPGDWLSGFSEVPPLDDGIRLSEQLSKPAACGLFPLATQTPSPAVGHVWVFADKDPHFIYTTETDNVHGQSWQLAGELARMVLQHGDKTATLALATRWICTGTCDKGRISSVGLGNKLQLDTKRNWLIPAENTLQEEAASHGARIYRAVSATNAYNLITGHGFQTGAGAKLPSPVDVLHSFVSDARTPVLMTALAVNPRRIQLWCSEKFTGKGRQLSEVILPHFLPSDCVIANPRTIDSGDIARIEQTLRPILQQEAIGNLQVVFNVTNGNFLQRLAAASIARSFPGILITYRDQDSKGLSLNTVSYLKHPPTTCTGTAVEIDHNAVNTTALTEYDDGKSTPEDFMKKLFPEK